MTENDINQQELEWLKLEYSYSQSLISGNKSARIYYLLFMITLNIAIYSGLNNLLNNILCFTLFVMNIGLYLLYIRSHSAEVDNMEQIKRIRQKLAGNRSLEEVDWFMFHKSFKDIFKGWGYNIILILLSLILAFSYLIALAINFGIAFNESVSVIVSNHFVFILFMLQISVFYLLGKSVQNKYN